MEDMFRQFPNEQCHYSSRMCFCNHYTGKSRVQLFGDGERQL